ncbi:hypothetical protein Tco_1064625 [Tanacetum coccineum]
MADDEDDEEPITEMTQDMGSSLAQVKDHVLIDTMEKRPTILFSQELWNVCNCQSQTQNPSRPLRIQLAGRGYTLHGDEALHMKRISLHQIRALLATGDIYGVYELYNMAHHDEDRDDKTEATPSMHPDIAQLLAQFELLF